MALWPFTSYLRALRSALQPVVQLSNVVEKAKLVEDVVDVAERYSPNFAEVFDVPENELIADITLSHIMVRTQALLAYRKERLEALQFEPRIAILGEGDTNKGANNILRKLKFALSSLEDAISKARLPPELQKTHVRLAQRGLWWHVSDRLKRIA